MKEVSLVTLITKQLQNDTEARLSPVFKIWWIYCLLMRDYFDGKWAHK